MAKKKIWTLDDRKMLESLLKQGFKISKISEVLGIGTASIYNEIRRGVSADEYNQHRYIKYTAKASIDNQISKLKAALGGEE